MPASVGTVKEKVQRYLTELIGRVELDGEGRLSFQYGSARVFVEVEPIGDDNTAVAITAPLIFNARRSPELFHYVATSGSYRFGHLAAYEADGGVQILYRHTLLGDYLDPDELNWAVSAMAQTADEVDTELQRRFGGELFHTDA